MPCPRKCKNSIRGLRTNSRRNSERRRGYGTAVPVGQCNRHFARAGVVTIEGVKLFRRHRYRQSVSGPITAPRDVADQFTSFGDEGNRPHAARRDAVNQTSLQCHAGARSSSLRGMPLTDLNCGSSKVTDLAPLPGGMPLEKSRLLQIADLRPLPAARLQGPHLGGCPYNQSYRRRCRRPAKSPAELPNRMGRSGETANSSARCFRCKVDYLLPTWPGYSVAGDYCYLLRESPKNHCRARRIPTFVVGRLIRRNKNANQSPNSVLAGHALLRRILLSKYSRHDVAPREQIQDYAWCPEFPRLTVVWNSAERKTENGMSMSYSRNHSYSTSVELLSWSSLFAIVGWALIAASRSKAKSTPPLDATGSADP